MNDDELLALCRQGDHAAFAQLVGQYRGIVWSVCLRVTGNRQDAEDALQNALTAAWQHLHKFRGDGDFKAWLYRIASNAAKTVASRDRDILTDNDDFIELVDNRPMTADRVADVDAVRRAIADLPEDFREAIVLREFAGLTYQEIADQQGISVQTVKSRINRARTRLVADLAPHRA
jgi:RNA polymerase sigma factor (sigma-70 family)